MTEATAERAPAAEPAFTPGPWQTSEYHTNAVTILADGVALADVMSLDSDEVDDTDRANARLIASAPVLLTELCNMVEIYWGLHGDHNGDGGEPPDCIVRARAVIAKVTGSAS